ncbi:conserved hypothetical protein [uncultured Mycobacterium sp.]|uniref:Uncharacterized protein n=1 Tax=uncultured Mycobacterium sp. TaxID=171292 RepID=A0A1Y5PRW7_9MYCO|nr:conserved hypothetical protein [uncultured Mycobacterium sp.]
MGQENAAIIPSQAVSRRPIAGIKKRMDTLPRLRHAEHRIVKIQRRVWLAQVLMWPTIIVGALLSAGALMWFLRRRSAGGRHEMPDLPGAHEAGAVGSTTG